MVIKYLPIVNYIFLIDPNNKGIFKNVKTFVKCKYKKLNFVRIYLLFDIFTKSCMQLTLKLL